MDDAFAPLTNFSQACFPPGTTAPVHRHADMVEIFLVQSGTACMTVEGIEHTLTAGSCIVIEPGEDHELSNASTTEAMVVIYCGFVV